MAGLSRGRQIRYNKFGMNLANRITFARFCIPPVLIPALLTDMRGGKCLALALFTVGALTDWLDGLLARRYGMESDFGRLMDPLADKLLVISALVCFVVMPPQVVRAWMLVIIIAREFIVTGLRQLALQQHTVMSAEAIGKHKTAWQMIGIFALLTYYAMGDLASVLPAALVRFCMAHGPRYLSALFYLITLLTLVSGVIYLWRYRSLYSQHT